MRHQAFLLRDVVGRSLQSPPALDPTFLTDTVIKLAQASYDNRELPSGHLDRRRLRMLADALQEAGCANADILGHLRGPGPCVRGCHFIDLLLKKE
jgi:hypothetical protein